MKTILLIGGAGYVGSVLTSYLLRSGYKIRVLDNVIYGHSNCVVANIGVENYEYIYGSLCDRKKLDIASENVDSVVILGGLVGDPITKKYPNLSESTNEIGIQSCIDYFDHKEIENLIFISTCSNYGLIPENKLADEEFELKPLSLYAKAKVAGEKHLLSKKDKVKYCGTVLRFATAFGLSPRMRFDLTLSEFTRDIYFQKDLLVFDEHTWRPYCHVQDFAKLIEKVLNVDKTIVNFEVFNAGGDLNNATKKMLVDSISKLIPNGQIKFGSNGNDPRNYKVSFKKVKNKLKFEPKYSIDYGINELINAFKQGLFSDSIIRKSNYGNYEIST